MGVSGEWERGNEGGWRDGGRVTERGREGER